MATFILFNFNCNWFQTQRIGELEKRLSKLQHALEVKKERNKSLLAQVEALRGMCNYRTVFVYQSAVIDAVISVTFIVLDLDS